MAEKNTTKGNDKILKLSKTYQFEGNNISEIDLSRLEDMTAADMIAAQKILTANGSVSIMPENSLEYALILAARATDQPVEFYQSLTMRDAMKVKNRVSGFIFGGGSD
jgi:hypothetical protein